MDSISQYFRSLAQLVAAVLEWWTENKDGDLQVNELHSRANSLAAKFQQGDGYNYIDEAILLAREALRLCPSGHPMRSISLSSLAIHLTDRYKQLGETVDVDEAINLDREALALRPPGHSGRSLSLNNLAVRLGIRYDDLGTVGDLNEAICLDHEALALRPPGHPDRSSSLNNLAVDLGVRYTKFGAIDDLSEAIRLNQEALALRPPGHTDRSESLNSLAVDLSTRYHRLGVMDDLNEAIRLHQEALTLRPPGHPDRSLSSNNLAADLGTRHDKLGATQDLDEAIRLNQEALTLRPPGHPLRSESLNNLAIDLRTRYDKLGEMEDLNESIRLTKDALALRPSGHPDRSSSLNNLALCLRNRYDNLEATDDLSEAIRLNLEALALYPPGHPDRPASLNSLAVLFSTCYDKLKVTDDLDEAIRLSQEALTLCPPGHPDRSRSLENLANCLQMRRLTQSNDEEEIFSVYAQLANISQTVSSDDLSAARAWIRRADEFRHPTIALAYETYLRLLLHYLATLPSLPQHLHLIKDHTSSFAMDAFAAYLRNHSPTKAVELLEQGRGTFWGQLTRLRSPVDSVIASGLKGKSLGEKFIHLTTLIRNNLHLPGIDQHDRVCHLNLELQSVVDSIRRLPGLSRFLLPSLCSDLQQAATEGPVIIVNMSKYSCDALIVLFDRDPVHIPLRVTSDRVRVLSSNVCALAVRAKCMEVGKDFKVVLREIWDEIVSPIVNTLREIRPLHSRIWWCPTAGFYLLPLHAADPYRKDQPKLADLYISSYTPSLSALIHARRQSSSLTSPKKRFVAMGEANAAAEDKLASIGDELADIGQRVRDVALFTSIEDAESCVSRVTEELRKSEWVHFACHGIPNRKQPFESAFALHDGRLTVQDITHYELKNAEFAYLSACHTAVGDSQSPDEMIHLASAMHFIGFRSVIGTMWAVDDRQATKITSMFYDNMIADSGRLDYTRAAYALHKTIREVSGVTLDQKILYIHIGA